MFIGTQGTRQMPKEPEEVDLNPDRPTSCKTCNSDHVRSVNFGKHKVYSCGHCGALLGFFDLQENKMDDTIRIIEETH